MANSGPYEMSLKEIILVLFIKTNVQSSSPKMMHSTTIPAGISQGGNAPFLVTNSLIRRKNLKVWKENSLAKCKDFKRMIHSGSIVLSFLFCSHKKFTVSHFVSPCVRSCMKNRSGLELFNLSTKGRVHMFTEDCFLRSFCLINT